MRAAAVDIGTNSVLMTVAERDRRGGLTVVFEQATITRLGEGVDASGVLAPEAIRRTLSTLGSYGEELRRLQVERTAAVATSAARDGDADGSFRRSAEALLGAPVQIISGAREAELTFRGALEGLSLEGPVAVFDVGGGSTEVVLGNRGARSTRIDRCDSLQLGAVRVTERSLGGDPPTPAQLMAARLEIARQLDTLDDLPEGTPLVGVAGTVTTVAAAHLRLPRYQGSLVHGTVLEEASIRAVTTRLAGLTAEQRREVPGVSAGRADIIVGGLLIVEEILRWAHAQRVIVSDHGVRYGLLDELLPGPPTLR